MGWRQVAASGIVWFFALFTFFLPLGCGRKETGEKYWKVILLNLDGGSWNIIHPLVQSGGLPSFKRLMDEGAYGTLYSKKAFSPSTWTTIFTGVPEEGHRIFNFFLNKEDFSQPQSPDLIPRFWLKDPEWKLLHKKTTFATPLHRKKPALWDLAGEGGRTVGGIGNLITYPPLPVNGWFVSGNCTPNVLLDVGKTVLLKPKMLGHAGYPAPSSFSPHLKASLKDDLGNSYLLVITDEKDDAITDYDTLYLYDQVGAIKPFQVLKKEEYCWIEKDLADRCREVFGRLNRVSPGVRKGIQWRGSAPSEIPPLEVEIPSGIAPANVGYQGEIPLFLCLTDSKGDGVPLYDTLQLSFCREGGEAKREGSFNPYGMDVCIALRPELSGRPFPLVLEMKGPEGLGIPPLYLFISGDEKSEEAIFLSKDPEFRQDEVPKEYAEVFSQWILDLRRAVLGRGSFLRGIQALKWLGIREGVIVCRWSHVYDTYKYPLHPFAYPEGLLKDFPLEKIPFDAEVCHNALLKWEWLRFLTEGEFPDLLVTSWTLSDKVQHEFWWDEIDPEVIQAVPYSRTVEKTWQDFDGRIGQIMKRMDDRTILFIVSDHGFTQGESRYTWFLVNNLLRDLGFLRLREYPLSSTKNPFDPSRMALKVEILWEKGEASLDPETTLHFALGSSPGEALAEQTWVLGSPGRLAHEWKAGLFFKTVLLLQIPQKIPQGNVQLWVRLEGGEKTEWASIGVLSIGPLERPDPLAVKERHLHILRTRTLAMEKPENLGEPIASLSLGKRVQCLGSRMLYLIREPFPSRPVQSRIDWEKTFAYFSLTSEPDFAPAGRGVYINMKGRLPKGSVVPGQETREKKIKLLTILENARIKGTDIPLFQSVSFPEEGSFFIKLGLNEEILNLEGPVQFEAGGETFPLAPYLCRSLVGIHSHLGVYLAWGKLLKSRGAKAPARDIDVAPTCLRWLSLPIPSHMAGRPIPGLFGEEEGDVLQGVDTNPQKVKWLLEQLGYIR